MFRSPSLSVHTISFWVTYRTPRLTSGSWGGKALRQVIKLLKRIVRRLRLLFCGLFTRPTAPRRAPWTSLIPSNPESAPKAGELYVDFTGFAKCFALLGACRRPIFDSILQYFRPPSQIIGVDVDENGHPFGVSRS